ncbi:hypothetical protein [Streptomyces hydrogenans]|uniref:Uncharacterized protein n=1 Tax=Streptomyces hydrogenans TaxID=1873719 RepID=A0ABQ3PJG0_9ACTN|nr:hypothetical protein [Streptomyces hydrogenans]GHF94624.1 hypothetical protein GCM10018784_02860 [Streptomyces hydrogenans]GHI25160.1 hypothetical protein Shyd_65310 [Streptomyces hydrogenans]
MRVEQRVQVRILNAQRLYSYAWWFDPTAGELPLQIGDKVELPPNQVQEEGSSGTVVAVGTSYKGELKSIVRLLWKDGEGPDSSSGWTLVETGPPDAPDGGLALRRKDAGDMWLGFGEGDYS